MKKEDLKKYEKQLILRPDFKKVCITHSENYNDYDEIYLGKKNKRGNKLFNYFYVGENKGRHEKNRNDVKPIEYYETHSIKPYSFQQKCKSVNMNYKFFERIESGETTTNNAKKYFFKYIGKEVTNSNISDKSSKVYYKFNSTEAYKFARICKGNNWDFDAFEKIDSGETSGKKKKYFFEYVGEELAKKKRKERLKKSLISYYETYSIPLYVFKKICEKRNLNFEDFQRIESGQRTGKNKKYFFKLKNKRKFI